MFFMILWSQNLECLPPCLDCRACYSLDRMGATCCKDELSHTKGNTRWRIPGRFRKRLLDVSFYQGSIRCFAFPRRSPQGFSGILQGVWPLVWLDLHLLLPSHNVAVLFRIFMIIMTSWSRVIKSYDSIVHKGIVVFMIRSPFLLMMTNIFFFATLPNHCNPRPKHMILMIA